MHAGICHHVFPNLLSMSNEFRIILMGSCTGSHTIITTRATIKIDQHGGCSVNETLLDKKFQHGGLDTFRGMSYTPAC
jgi:hypothetical protein